MLDSIALVETLVGRVMREDSLECDEGETECNRPMVEGDSWGLIFISAVTCESESIIFVEASFLDTLENGEEYLSVESFPIKFIWLVLLNWVLEPMPVTVTVEGTWECNRLSMRLE